MDTNKIEENQDMSVPYLTKERGKQAEEKHAEKPEIIGDSPEEKLLREEKRRETINTHFGNQRGIEEAKENENTEILNNLLDKANNNGSEDENLSIEEKLEANGEPTEEGDEGDIEGWIKAEDIKSVISGGWDKIKEKVRQLKGDPQAGIPWEENQEE